MQIVKHMLPVMLAFTLLLAGCSSPEEKAIKEVITNELDLLKDLDSGAFEDALDTLDEESACMVYGLDPEQVEDCVVSPLPPGRRRSRCSA